MSVIGKRERSGGMPRSTEGGVLPLGFVSEFDDINFSVGTESKCSKPFTTLACEICQSSTSLCFHYFFY
jgi:hypothetical protein